MNMNGWLLRHRHILVEQWAAMHVKAAIIVWAIAYAWHPPTHIVEELGYGLVYISALFSVFGSIMGITGLVMTNAKKVCRRYQGLVVEFSGLTIATCGPLTYFITIAYLTITSANPQGHSFAAISYALCAFMIARIIVVRRGFKEAG